MNRVIETCRHCSQANDLDRGLCRRCLWLAPMVPRKVAPVDLTVLYGQLAQAMEGM